jgi:tartrate-resistant acid phosphatase type 5
MVRILAALLLLTACEKSIPNTAAIAKTAASQATSLSSDGYRFAVIGDYGSGDENEALVASLVRSWQPKHVLTLGDNVYPTGGSASYDENIGKYYAEFIGSYRGAYGTGSMSNRFWPAPGNHDWYETAALEPYRAFFTLPEEPASERYYQVALDARVQLYVLDSDPREPDGITADSKQAQWLRGALSANQGKSCFHLVTMHHPPYTTQTGHASAVAMRWPFKDWGADLVMAGHNHHYERLEAEGLTYLVNGTGGASVYPQRAERLPESKVFVEGKLGAVLGTVGKDSITLEYFEAETGKRLDQFTLRKTCP